jgi:hypothetical protein
VKWITVAGRPQKNGEEFTVALSISLIEDGESIPFVGRLRDMTERDGLRCALLGVSWHAPRVDYGGQRDRNFTHEKN